MLRGCNLAGVEGSDPAGGRPPAPAPSLPPAGAAPAATVRRAASSWPDHVVLSINAEKPPMRLLGAESGRFIWIRLAHFGSVS